MPDNEKKLAEEPFFKELIDTEVKEKTPEELKAEEEQRIKNKNAEEARKRRESELKLKEEKKKEQEKVEQPKVEQPKVETPKQDETNKLGEQLVSFKTKYPDVDLSQLDKDVQFKKYIDGKLLGKKDFTVLYEEYMELRSEISGTPKSEVQKNYERKAQSSSGSSVQTGVSNAQDVYSEEELSKLALRLPLMSDKEAKKIMEKFDKSIQFYKKKGR